MDRLTSDGRLFDYGPYELHATPGAGGTAPTRELDGSYSFSAGANKTFVLPMRFFSVAPIAEYTWLLSFAASHPTAGNNAQLQSWETNVGNSYGIFAYQDTSSNLQLVNMRGIVTQPMISVSLRLPRITRHCVAATVETTPRAVGNGAALTATWTVGAWGNPVYFGAAAPQLGFGTTWTGSSIQRMYYTAIIRGAISSPDMAALSEKLMMGQKPFCVRQ